MRRTLAFVGGLLSGGLVGTAAALLFAPFSGTALRAGLRGRYARAIQAGQDAARRKREELEARLAEMTGPHPPDSPTLANQPRQPGR